MKATQWLHRFIWILRQPKPMHELKLHLIKQLTVKMVKVAAVFVPVVSYSSDDAAVNLLNQFHKDLINIMRKEQAAISERENMQADNNLVTASNAAFKLLRYLASVDPYYNRWLGYSFYAAYRVWLQSEAEYIVECKRQGCIDVSDKFLADVFRLHCAGGLILYPPT